MKKGYDTVLCIRSGNGFKYGTVYPAMGNNNGTDILYEEENSYGVKIVGISTAHTYRDLEDTSEKLKLVNGIAEFVYLRRRKKQ